MTVTVPTLRYCPATAVPEPVHVSEAPGAGRILGQATATPRSSVTVKLVKVNALLLVITYVHVTGPSTGIIGPGRPIGVLAVGELLYLHHHLVGGVPVSAHLALHRRRATDNRDAQLDHFLIDDVRQRHG